ncbi:MAG: FkbM family methyltransferase [Actinomycetota bacterium]|nr:FkbM family methyltransferase [Actinomycetota bacterium]
MPASRSSGSSEGCEARYWDEPASFEDVLACYRLLLGREADPGGIAHHRERLGRGGISVGQLVEEFVGSVEFVRAHGLGRTASAPPTEAVSTEEGFLVHVDPTDYAVGHTISVTGAYEPGVSATVRSLLRPGATFVDAGANIGWFSLLAAGLVGPTGRVVAVEPNPLNCDLARRSVEDNGFGNIEVFTVALSDQTGTVALETDGSNGRIVPVDSPPPQPVRVNFVVAARTLDSLLKDAGVTHVDVVKLDVEGAEPLVLAGAAEMLARDRPALVSEFYPLALDSSPWGGAGAYLAQLRQLGYRLSAIGFGAGPGDDQDDATLLSLARDGKGQIDLLATPIQ